jgi:hypothetical protein
MAFGVLHALDIAGGTLSALLLLLLVSLRIAVSTVILYAVLPLAVSAIVFFLVQRKLIYPNETRCMK